MATRQEERQGLREERLAREKEAQAAAKRRLFLGYVVAGLLGAAVVAGVVVVALSSDGAGGTGSVDDSSPFGTHYEGLEQRRLAAGVPTMAEGGGSHFHPSLSVYVNGEPLTVPANIGVDPSNPPTMMAGLHTHDETGVIHNEAGTGATLGDFFAIWGVPFSSERLGPYRAGGGKVVRIWVDGKPSPAFGDLQLEDGQQTVIDYAARGAPPPPLD